MALKAHRLEILPLGRASMGLKAPVMNLQEIEALVRIGLESIRDVFSARKSQLNPDGEPVDLGPIMTFVLLLLICSRISRS